MQRQLIPLLLCAGALLAAGAGRAAEGYDSCAHFVTSLPAVITAQGTWCMDRDLSTTMAEGRAIDIQANNVTLDCNHFKLGGLAAGEGTRTLGIVAIDRANTTIRNCTVRGFEKGIVVSSHPLVPSAHVVEDNRLDGNTYQAIFVGGAGAVVRRNLVLDTGGSTHSGGAMGIIAGRNVDVVDNTIDGVMGRAGANGNVYGILVSQGTAVANGSSFVGNRLRNLVPSGTGFASAIHVESSNSAHANWVTVAGNHLVGGGIASSTGIYCDNPRSRAKDNTLSGFAVAMTGCGDALGNEVAP